jgi:methylated-DNA-[protein]-cysteine S-methyltransferase
MGFNENVWKLCKQIPKGKVTTYKLIADELGNKAYRAVGGALNKNPYWPEVPCHRVVGSDGSLTGFASGLDKKRDLLIAEGIEIINDKIDLKKCLFKFK